MERAKAAVVAIYSNGAPHATGFLVSPTLLVTCFHSIAAYNKDKEQWRLHLEATFSFKVANSGVDVNFKLTDDTLVFPPTEYVAKMTTVGMDVAILRVQEVAGITRDNCIRILDDSWPAFLNPDTIPRELSQSVHVVGFQKFDETFRKTISWNSNKLLAFVNYEVYYSTFSGVAKPEACESAVPQSIVPSPADGVQQCMSGAPVLLPNGVLLGVHRRAFRPENP